MKQSLLLFFIILSASLLHGQVTILNNIPPVIDPGTETTVQVTINKGSLNGFARYQIDVPEGITIQEDDSKGGTFAFENSHAKIFWAEVPSNIEVIITMKLTAASYLSSAKITQKFYYMENGAKKEMETDPINIVIKGDQLKKLQAEQLKKDSKDAYQTGLKEQQAADKKIADADDAIKKAEAIQNEDEKKAALQKATTQKQKAETDKSVASKILALAKSLDDNANEIEQLNKMSSSSGSGSGTGSASGSGSSGSATGSASDNSAGSSSSSGSAVSMNGTVYRLQLGAFSQNPTKVLFKHMGLIEVVNEDGMYKVLMGKFVNKEDALKRRSELIARSFDCFVVTYKDGVRVK